MIELLNRLTEKNSTCSDSEDDEILLAAQPPHHRDAADAGPPIGIIVETDDSEDLDAFWKTLNADRARAMDRMRFNYQELQDQSASRSQINQV